MINILRLRRVGLAALLALVAALAAAALFGGAASAQTSDDDAITYSSISAGGAHTCAVRADTGAVVCWGWDLYGRLDAPAGSFSAVNAGAQFACANQQRRRRGGVLGQHIDVRRPDGQLPADRCRRLPRLRAAQLGDGGMLGQEPVRPARCAQRHVQRGRRGLSPLLRAARDGHDRLLGHEQLGGRPTRPRGTISPR